MNSSSSCDVKKTSLLFHFNHDTKQMKVQKQTYGLRYVLLMTIDCELENWHEIQVLCCVSMTKRQHECYKAWTFIGGWLVDTV